MNTYPVKARHILPAYFVVTIGTITVLALIRYLLAIETTVLDFKLEVWEFWIPMALPWIPITIWLRPKFRILSFKSESDRRRFGFQMLSWIAMALPMIISQTYVTSATGKMQTVANVAELDQKEATRFYRIESFQAPMSHGASHADVRASGKHNEHLDIKFFFVFPIVKDSLTNEVATTKYWYGVSYKKQISNRIEDAEKEALYKAFANECLANISHYNFHDYTYLERLGNSEKRDGYLKATQDAGIAEGAVILEAQHESFENRAGKKLRWIFGTYFIATSIVLLVLLWPSVDEEELARQRAGKKPAEDDVVDMIKFLIPRKPHVFTSWVLDANIVVFLVMVIAGVHFISPNASELLVWGAHRRTEVLQGEWWRLFTSMFVHGGVMHLILNIYGLVIASMFLEPLLGTKRYAIVYIVSGLVGSIASIWWYDNTVSVGASGAIFGLFGAILALTLTGAFGKGGGRFMLMLFGPYVAINLLFGLTGGIDNAAHLGGLFGGAIVTFMMSGSIAPPMEEEPTEEATEEAIDDGTAADA